MLGKFKWCDDLAYFFSGLNFLSSPPNSILSHFCYFVHNKKPTRRTVSVFANYSLGRISIISCEVGFVKLAILRRFEGSLVSKR